MLYSSWPRFEDKIHRNAYTDNIASILGGTPPKILKKERPFQPPIVTPIDGVTHREKLWPRSKQGRPYSHVSTFLHVDLWKQTNRYLIGNRWLIHIQPHFKVSPN